MSSFRRRVVFSCEACGSHLIKRTSFLAHQFLRNDTYICDNPMCGASYTGHTELTALASPSGMPNAASELPETPALIRARHLQQYQQMANETQADLFEQLHSNDQE